METMTPDPAENFVAFSAEFKNALNGARVSNQLLNSLLNNSPPSEQSFDANDTYPVQEGERVATTQENNFLN